MYSILFGELVGVMTRKFTKEKKKIALAIDNCGANPTIDNLSSTEFIFLPPNPISKLKAVNQGVIHILRAYYKSLALQRLVASINTGKELQVFFDFRRNENHWFGMTKSKKFHHQLLCESRMKMICSKIFNIKQKSFEIFILQAQQLKVSFREMKTWWVNKQIKSW